MGFFTFWILVCVINAILSFVFNAYLLKQGEDVTYSLLFVEAILTLASFIGTITAIVMTIGIFLIEHGDEPAIKSKHRKN